jgi:urease gamma subunit
MNGVLVVEHRVTDDVERSERGHELAYLDAVGFIRRHDVELGCRKALQVSEYRVSAEEVLLAGAVLERIVLQECTELCFGKCRSGLVLHIAGGNDRFEDSSGEAKRFAVWTGYFFLFTEPVSTFDFLCLFDTVLCAEILQIRTRISGRIEF